MKNYKKILIMRWGEDNMNRIFKRQKVKFPEKCIVTIDFQNDVNKIIGYGNNFKNTPKGIICDVFLEKKPTNTIAPGFKLGDKIIVYQKKEYPKDLELFELSIVTAHANKKCNNNLK